MNTLPILHSNGSGKRLLQSTYDAAADDLRKFVESWGNVEFNARDYYVSGDPLAWQKAITERDAMSAKLREIHRYLETIREHLYS